MRNIVLFITYFPFSLLTPIIFPGDDGKAKEPIIRFTDQTKIIGKDTSHFIVSVTVEPGSVSGEVWLELCDTAGLKLRDTLYCKRPIAPKGGSISFACRIDALHCGTAYILKLVTKDLNAPARHELLKDSTKKCPPPPPPPKEKKKDKEK